MKSISLFFSAICLFCTLGCKLFDDAFEPVNLSGRWVGVGYQCEQGVQYSEIVEITHIGNEISAIKITGDPCVPAGSKTFYGNFDLDLNAGEIIWTTGTPSQPASDSATGNIRLEGEILKAISSTSEQITFTREQ